MRLSIKEAMVWLYSILVSSDLGETKLLVMLQLQSTQVVRSQHEMMAMKQTDILLSFC